MPKAVPRRGRKPAFDLGQTTRALPGNAEGDSKTACATVLASLDRRGLFAGPGERVLFPGWSTATDPSTTDTTVSADAGGHREDGALDGGNRIARENAQTSAPLLGGFDDDVAALRWID